MTASKAALVRQGTTVDRMLELLSDDIVSGRLLPGTKLEAQSVARRFSVSRTPVRETFSQLAALGLVERRPNRGVTVTEMSEGSLGAMFEAMSELEAACARLAALRMSLAERQAFRQAHIESIDIVRDGQPDDYDHFNHGFHTRLFEGSHSPYLIELAQATRARVKPFRRAQFQVPTRASVSWEEHDAIVQAIMAGDPEAAARATRSHLSSAGLASSNFVKHSQTGRLQSS
ncbi:GntR family transcriptional regulator [Allohahella marinimesophila]|uniref:GntR family transcriptional regulator n=1 Tax=Allohahella marinimesophila TaxID=1054972 RepID=A0ABP7NWG0_9GAMM